MVLRKSTVHNWILSFQYGEEREVPENCDKASVKEYGATRFGYTFQDVGENRIKRVCPKCSR